MKNYYSILQIPEDSNRDDIQKAYRMLAKKYHPDVNKSPDAHEKFCEIFEAYEFLMNHWPLHAEAYTNQTGYEQKYNEYRQTAEYERFRREARERSQQQAKMRYEKFRKQHEAFQESGINDIALIFTMLIRLFSVPFFLFLLLIPLVLAILYSWALILLGILLWPFAAIIAWYYYDNRKLYFFPGKLYYSPSRILHLFTDKHQSSQQCYYCPNKPADSKPYKIDLLKLKEVKFRSGGYRQQNVNYINQNVSILVPRSQKAFVVHSINILLKSLSIFYCLTFLNISSATWRIIIGLVMGGIISRMHLLLSQTKSNVTYLISYGLVIRVSCWILGVVLVSRFYSNPFDISTNDYINFVITAIIIFDSLLMQLINLALGHNSDKPIFQQFPETANKFKEGYSVYNDIPVISVVYPLFKWIFG